MQSSSNPTPYDAEFYAARRPLLPEYRAMADVLYQVFGPKRCFDFGCGPGEILGRLKEHGVRVMGIDASVHAMLAAKLAGVPMFQADLTTCTAQFLDADLVLCLETAEHISAHKADALVEFIAKNTTKWLVWSAATPGQGGTDHLNEQPEGYWLSRFARCGLTPALMLTRAMRLLFAHAAHRQPWYGLTTVVLERA